MSKPELKNHVPVADIDVAKNYTVTSTGTASNLGPAGQKRGPVDGNTAKVLIQKGYISPKVTEYVAPKKVVKKAEDK